MQLNGSEKIGSFDFGKASTKSSIVLALCLAAQSSVKASETTSKLMMCTNLATQFATLATLVSKEDKVLESDGFDFSFITGMRKPGVSWSSVEEIQSALNCGNIYTGNNSISGEKIITKITSSKIKQNFLLLEKNYTRMLNDYSLRELHSGTDDYDRLCYFL